MATSDLEQLKALGSASLNKTEDFATDVAAYVVEGATSFATGSLGLPPVVADALSRRLHILVQEGIARSRLRHIRTTKLVVIDETEDK
jgi:hypothetical protein